MLGSGEVFVGRADELRQVTAVLAATGQVTVVGGPGVGKTTLALEVARGGDAAVALCRLGELAPGATVVPAIAVACGAQEQAGVPLIDAVVMTVAGDELTLVLDGADVVTDELAGVIDRLRLDCPRLRVLVTSRVPVRCRAETVVRLEPLDDVASTELVRHHAGTEASDELVGALARELGGIPLALVVGARGWAKGQVPVAAGRDAVSGAVSNVMDALPVDARYTLAFGAVLPGGAPGEVLRHHGPIDALVDTGLVAVDSGRYRLPDPVRDVVVTRLTPDERAVAREQRRTWLHGLLDGIPQARSASDERLRLDLAERELANIAAAITEACEGDDADTAARIALGAVRVWMARARISEGARLVDIARQAATPHRARLTYYAGALAHLAGRIADATAAFADAEDEAVAQGDDGTVALARAGRATLSFLVGDRATAAELAAGAAEAASRTDDAAAHLVVAATRGTVARITGALDDAEAAYAGAIATARTVGDHRSMATALLGAGSVAQLRGALDDAHARFVEAREVAQAAGHPAQLAAALGILGALAEARGDLDESRRLLSESLSAAEAAGDHRTQLETLLNLGGCEIDAADIDAARRHLSTALRLARRLTDRRLAAFALAGLAECALADGDLAAAARLEREALVSRRDLADRRALALALEETAEIVTRAELVDDALILLRGADGIRGDAGLARSASEAARVERIEAAARAAALDPTPATVDRTDAVNRALTLLDRIAGVPADAAPVRAAPAAASTAAIGIRTLGGFVVEVEGRAVAPEAWGSRRARQLVKMLVAARGRPLPREQLTAALWPEATPEEEGRLGARLSVLLSTARKVLGGGITADRAAVALDLGAVDSDLERLFTAARDDRLKDVVELYAGDFLPEDLYEEWASPPREAARLAFLTAVRRLARASAGAGELDRAADLCLRTLEADPYDDDAHRFLVTTLAAANRPGEASRAYQQYAARMNELGLEPPPFNALAAVAEAPLVPVQR